MSTSAMIEILTPAQILHASKLCGIDEFVLIANSGRAVAGEISRRYSARNTVVLCGSSSVGNIGRAAAGHLKSWGWPIEFSAENLGGASLIIDALHTTDLEHGLPKSIADNVNGSDVPIVSIDLPSGIDDLTGRTKREYIRAKLCITFFRKKPAHVLFPGRALCGEVIVLDNGIPDLVADDVAPNLWENVRPQLPIYLMAGHKYHRGHAIVLSGDRFNTGASRLAAQAALKIGAGLVTLTGDTDALLVHANHVTAIMLAEISTGDMLSEFITDPRKNVICVGPAAGINETTREYVRIALASGKAVVLDADALIACSENATELFQWVLSLPLRAVVMTPHEGEFARLFGDSVDRSGSKIERTRMAAQISGATVVLKGADTVISHPDGRAVVNTNAPASLATAGSGDVLAGMITGLIAQGMMAFEAACAAVWIHGETAQSFGNRTFTADELVRHIGQKQQAEE